jgi:hypothetical protein
VNLLRELNFTDCRVFRRLRVVYTHFPGGVSVVPISLPSFSVPGVVADTRDLKTKEGKVWCYAVKVMAMGGTFELQTPDEKLAKSIGAGQQVVATGRFEFFNNAIKLILTKLELAK